MPSSKSKSFSLMPFLVWLLIVATVVLLIYFNSNQFRTLKEQMVLQLETNQNQLSRQFADHVEAHLDLLAFQLRQLATTEEIQYAEKGITAVLDNSFYDASTPSSVVDLAFIDKEGVLVYGVVNQELTGKSFATRKYFRLLKKMPPNSFVTSELLTFRGASYLDKKGVILATNVYQTIKDEFHPSPSGDFIGVVAAPIYLRALADDLTAHFRKTSKGGGGVMWLLDSYGEIIYHSANPDFEGKSIASFTDKNNPFNSPPMKDISSKMLHQKAGTARVHIDDQDMLINYFPIIIGNTFWSIGYAIPYSPIAQTINTSFRYSIYAFLLTTSLLIFLLAYFSILNRRRIAAENEVIYKDIIETKNVDLQKKTEELGLANEEMLSTNEELTISNQELESSYEQLRATTEELTATYRELNEAQEKLKENYETVQKANQELHRINRMKSDFISMASHELKTPLTPIKGYSYLLLRDKKNKFDSRSQEMFRSIAKSADRLESIINDMLDISRIEAKKLNLEYSSFSLLKLLENIRNDIESFLETRRQKLTIEDKNSEDVFIEADHNRLYQMFLSVIGNAMKFSPDNQLIEIIIESQTNDMVHVKIIDTGIGIDPDELERIFDEFYEVGEMLTHSTDKVKFMGAGSGLGLAISRGIVEAHRGKIWAESICADPESCLGSTFHVLLPIKSGREVQVELFEQPPAPRTAPGEKRAKGDALPRILLIEDEEDIIELTRIILGPDYQLEIALDGMEGLKKAFDFKPDLILLDIYFPGPNGFEICELLKKNEQTRHIPIALFTASSQQAEIDRGFAVGANDYIVKPFENQELIERVERLLKLNLRSH